MSHTFRFRYTGDAAKDSEQLIAEVEQATLREETPEEKFAEYLRDLAAHLRERADLVETL